MSAGLPGLGLGGLFFVLSALLAPAVELGRTARGQSSPEAWRQCGRQFALALAMVAVVTWFVPLKPIGITMAVLVTVLLLAKAAQLALRATSRFRTWRTRPRDGMCPQACSCCGEVQT